MSRSSTTSVIMRMFALAVVRCKSNSNICVYRMKLYIGIDEKFSLHYRTHIHLWIYVSTKMIVDLESEVVFVVFGYTCLR